MRAPVREGRALSGPECIARVKVRGPAGRSGQPAAVFAEGDVSCGQRLSPRGGCRRHPACFLSRSSRLAWCWKWSAGEVQDGQGDAFGGQQFGDTGARTPATTLSSGDKAFVRLRELQHQGAIQRLHERMLTT